MNINSLQKHYDKLTARERFVLTVQASAREDESEYRALIDSAPVIGFEFPHTQGLHEGFRQLVKHHMIQQLGTAATFFMLIGFDDESERKFNTTAHGEPVTLGDGIEITARRFMEDLEAFNQVCQAYGIDAKILKREYGYNHVLIMADAIIRTWYGEDYSTALLTDLESTITEYKNLIEHAREFWAEAKAK